MLGRCTSLRMHVSGDRLPLRARESQGPLSTVRSQEHELRQGGEGAMTGTSRRRGASPRDEHPKEGLTGGGLAVVPRPE